MTIEQRLDELGIRLPDVPSALASYVPVVVSGNLAFVSGQIPIEHGRPLTGLVGKEIDIDNGARLARHCGLQAVAALQAELGSLDRLRRVVKVTVWIASGSDFRDQSRVANGVSDLLRDIFGDGGRHARVAVSVPALPFGAPVEVDLIVEVGP